MKLLFVVNPISGGVDKEPFMKEASAFCEKYGIQYEVFKTTGKNDEENLNSMIISFQPDKVASVGGDGTTLFTGVCLRNSGIPMGIIPLGSANGMAIELYVNRNPMEALKEMVISEVYADLDLILVNDEHYCLHIGDVGINAQIVDQYEKDENRGMVTYAKYFAETLRNQKMIDYEVLYDGKSKKGSAKMLALCNARKYGTGVVLSKNGNPFDGLMELVIINEVSTQNLIKAGLSAIDERFADESTSDVIQCAELEIKLNEKEILQLDGEVIGETNSIHAKIIKSAIRFISHKDNSYLSDQ